MNLRPRVQRSATTDRVESRYVTIPNLRVFDLGADRVGEDWLDRPVLVSVGQFRKLDERGVVYLPSACAVRLVATNDCEICTAYTAQHGSRRGVERGARLSDREPDLLGLTSLEDGGWSRATPYKRPSDVIKGTPVIVRNVPEPQPPLGRERFDGLDAPDDAMTLPVVLASKPLRMLEARLLGKSDDLFVEIENGRCPSPT